MIIESCAQNDSNELLKNDEEVYEEQGIGLTQYHCDYCQKDITDVFRIRCGECQDFDLCVSCFLQGVETGTHSNNHSYIPIGRTDISLFSEDWNADEEIMLLEGVSKFGFGNWAEISDLVGPYNKVPKTKEECEQHYYDVYVMPVEKERIDILTNKLNSINYSKYGFRKIKNENSAGKFHDSIKEPASSNCNSSCKIVGFMPLRGDFDVEYDNDTELILSDIEFRGDETPQERELKWKVLDVYNAKLDERILRKRIVVEQGLGNWRRILQLYKKKTKEETDLYHILRLLMRFNLDCDLDELIDLFMAEIHIRRRIRKLQEWQSLGLQSYRDVELYQIKKKNIRRKVDHKISLSTLDISNDKCSEYLKAKEKISNSKSSNEISHNTNIGKVNLSKEEYCLESEASNYPGAKFLSPKEIDFCNNVQLPPIYFLFVKHTLLNVYMQNSDFSRIENIRNFSIDGIRKNLLYDFIIHSDSDGFGEFPSRSNELINKSFLEHV